MESAKASEDVGMLQIQGEPVGLRLRGRPRNKQGQDLLVRLILGKDLLGNVVDNHGTFKVGHGWITAVLLTDE